jgi:hypothetical protein
VLLQQCPKHPQLLGAQAVAGSKDEVTWTSADLLLGLLSILDGFPQLQQFLG